MEKLWAPWRVKYITNIAKGLKGCIFCNIYKEKKDKKNFINYIYFTNNTLCSCLALSHGNLHGWNTKPG